MKAILVIDLEDDVNLNDVEIRYAIQNMYGMPVKAEVNGCPLKPMPTKITTATLSELEQERTELLTEMASLKAYADGWNACLEELAK